MIETKTRYYIVCDRCGEKFGSSGSSTRDIEYSAEHNEWITVSQKAADYKHYCPKCKLTNGVKE